MELDIEPRLKMPDVHIERFVYNVVKEYLSGRSAILTQDLDRCMHVMNIMQVGEVYGSNLCSWDSRAAIVLYMQFHPDTEFNLQFEIMGRPPGITCEGLICRLA